MKFIAFVLIIVGLLAVGAMLSVFLLGLNSPVSAFLAPYLCGADKELIVGDFTPSIPNTVPLACDDPDSQFGTSSAQAQLIQFTLFAFIPFGIGLWLMRLAMRWQAAGQWTQRNYGSGGASKTAAISVELDAIAAKLKRGEISKDEATRQVMELADKQ